MRLICPTLHFNLKCICNRFEDISSSIIGLLGYFTYELQKIVIGSQCPGHLLVLIWKLRWYPDPLSNLAVYSCQGLYEEVVNIKGL